jgi:hypothetical protein
MWEQYVQAMVHALLQIHAHAQPIMEGVNVKAQSVTVYFQQIVQYATVMAIVLQWIHALAQQVTQDPSVNTQYVSQ